MKNNITVIILAARNQIAFSNYNSQMIPIHGKPAIAWVIDRYIEKEIILVMNKNNIKLKTYIEYNYPTIKTVYLDMEREYKKYKQYSIVTSLQEGLHAVSNHKSSISIVLGDTYCKADYTKDANSIIVSHDIMASDKWCLVDKNEKDEIISVFDKVANIHIGIKSAAVGIYNFSDQAFLKKITAKVLNEGLSKISDILQLYHKKYKIKCIETDNWIDFGHKAGIIKAQKEFYNSRNFNQLVSDNIKCIITKKSTNKQKLEDEYDWYLNIPKELQSFVPRVFSGISSENTYELSMEKYGYPPLSELWVFGDFDLEEWQLILEYLLKIRECMNSYSGNLTYNNFYDLYVTKLCERLNILKKTNSYWADIMQLSTIRVNQRKYKNISYFYEILIDECKKLADNASVSVMHGDFCFSNILFDTQNFICKLIDPRGRLSEKTIFGDARYDIAKLRHSIVGGYDYVIHKLYNFSEDENGFHYKDLMSSMQEQLKIYFDTLVVKYGYNLKEISLIEACLFLSMIPLHSEDFERQKIFYIKGIIKLNGYFEEQNYE